jgi:hypothetical protein
VATRGTAATEASARAQYVSSAIGPHTYPRQYPRAGKAGSSAEMEGSPHQHEALLPSKSPRGETQKREALSSQRLTMAVARSSEAAAASMG